MRLKYEISQATYLEPPEIIRRILIKLQDGDYKALKVTDNSVTFKHILRRFTFPVKGRQGPTKIERGMFEITTFDKKSTVVFKYYIRTLPLILFSFVFGAISVVTKTYPGILMALIVPMAIIIVKIGAYKNISKNMFDEILKTE